MTESPGQANDHLTDEEVAGYLDRSLRAPERDKVEGHLAACAECRAEMRAAAQVVRFQTRRKMWYGGAWVLAAAAVTTLFIASPFTARAPEGPTLRAPGTPLDVGDRLVSVIAPENGVSIQRDQLTFVWRPVEADARYRFTLTNVVGEVFWTADTSDTVLSIPTEVELESGQSYVWYVDVLLLDGRSITTGTRRFELIR
ncbi:anti-sigma factor family protein [Gemmatimonadota bacterium]